VQSAAAAGVAGSAEESQKSSAPALRQLERPSMLSVFNNQARGALPAASGARWGRHRSPFAATRATPRAGRFQAGHPVGRCGNRRLHLRRPGFRAGPTRGSGGVHRGHGVALPLAERTGIGAARFGHMGQTQPSLVCAAPGRTHGLKAHESGPGVRCARFSNPILRQT